MVNIAPLTIWSAVAYTGLWHFHEHSLQSWPKSAGWCGGSECWNPIVSAWGASSYWISV